MNKLSLIVGKVALVLLTGCGGETSTNVTQNTGATDTNSTSGASGSQSNYTKTSDCVKDGQTYSASEGQTCCITDSDIFAVAQGQTCNSGDKTLVCSEGKVTYESSFTAITISLNGNTYSCQ